MNVIPLIKLLMMMMMMMINGVCKQLSRPGMSVVNVVGKLLPGLISLAI